MEHLKKQLQLRFLVLGGKVINTVDLLSLKSLYFGSNAFYGNDITTSNLVMQSI